MLSNIRCSFHNLLISFVFLEGKVVRLLGPGLCTSSDMDLSWPIYLFSPRGRFFSVMLIQLFKDRNPSLLCCFLSSFFLYLLFIMKFFWRILTRNKLFLFFYIILFPRYTLIVSRVILFSFIFITQFF